MCKSYWKVLKCLEQVGGAKCFLLSLRSSEQYEEVKNELANVKETSGFLESRCEGSEEVLMWS